MDAKEFEHLKKLCRLDCTPDEEVAILNSLQNVLGYIEQLKEVNTDNVEPCNFVSRSMTKNEMRDDVVKDILPRDRFLADAPDQIGGMVRVPVLKTTT